MMGGVSMGRGSPPPIPVHAGVAPGETRDRRTPRDGYSAARVQFPGGSTVSPILLCVLRSATQLHPTQIFVTVLTLPSHSSLDRKSVV